MLYCLNRLLHHMASLAAGTPVIVGVAGFALIAAVVLFEAEQPDAFVTTSVRLTFPEAPAV